MVITLYSLNSHYWIWDIIREACIISWYRKLSHFRRTWRHMFNLRNKDRLGKNVTSFFIYIRDIFLLLGPYFWLKWKVVQFFTKKCAVLRASWHMWNIRNWLNSKMTCIQKPKKVFRYTECFFYLITSLYRVSLAKIKYLCSEWCNF